MSRAFTCQGGDKIKINSDQMCSVFGCRMLEPWPWSLMVIRSCYAKHSCTR